MEIYESYGSPIDPKGNAERERRYRDLAFAPAGPLRSDLGLALSDFFWEPFYQLLRQQTYQAVLQRPDDFVSVATEEVFAPLIASSDPEAAEWAAYLRERYPFLG